MITEEEKGINVERMDEKQCPKQQDQIKKHFWKQRTGDEELKKPTEHRSHRRNCRAKVKNQQRMEKKNPGGWSRGQRMGTSIPRYLNGDLSKDMGKDRQKKSWRMVAKRADCKERAFITSRCSTHNPSPSLVAPAQSPLAGSSWDWASNPLAGCPAPLA